MAKIPASSWLNTFLQETATVASPELFRLWAGLSAVSAVARRRLWTVFYGERVFANLYVLLVGPPSSGKTRAIRLAGQIVSKIPKIRLFPNKNTQESAIKSLQGSLTTFEYNGALKTQSAISGFFDEFVNFVPARDYDFMAILTDWFDCADHWTYRTISRGEDKAENVFTSFIGGITPKNMVHAFGQGALGLGFTSRLNIVFCEDSIDVDPWGDTDEDPEGMPVERDYSSLLPGLERISNMVGPVKVLPEARAVAREWRQQGMTPLPADSRLADYNGRRLLHWVKLAMILAVSEGKYAIEASHMHIGKELLLEVEATMPLALEHLGTNPMAEAVNQLHRWALVQFLSTGRKPIPEAQIIRRLMADVPQQYHASTIEYMLNSRMFTALGTAPSRMFTPQKVDR